jgi:hypothetical protein
MDGWILSTPKISQMILRDIEIASGIVRFHSITVFKSEQNPSARDDDWTVDCRACKRFARQPRVTVDDKRAPVADHVRSLKRAKFAKFGKF